MTRRRTQLFEQPSLVPMADMVTNTVGIMLFILIFVSLSAGGVIISRHLPRERATHAHPVWLYCAHGRIVSFDANELGRELALPLGEPSGANVEQWARRYSGRSLTTDDLFVSGEADTENGGLRQLVAVRARPDRGDDEAAIRNSASSFQRLLTQRSRTDDFLFFFVSPDSVRLFRAARDRAAEAGYQVGWTPVAPDVPARVSLSGSGREATIQ